MPTKKYKPVLKGHYRGNMHIQTITEEDARIWENIKKLDITKPPKRIT